MSVSYWLDLFTYQTWTEFLAAGGQVTGFRQSRWNTVKRMKPGDVLLCYLTGVSRWIGLLEVTGEPLQDSSPIWSVDDFPARIPVRVTAKLEPSTAVPVIDMKDRLSVFQNLSSPHAWTGHFRGSPTLWEASDGEAVVAAVKEAEAHPVERSFDPSKLKKVPPILKAPKLGSVVIPDDEEETGKTEAGATPSEDVSPSSLEIEQRKEATAHTEIQWLLLKLGSEMGLDVWVARNDRSKSFNGESYGSIRRLRQTLPQQADEATERTIALIDVLWLQDNSIQAAFEIESTTSIFSGLLRMSDLIAMHPNLNIPLYIVAPAERRSKVLSEINRPTFRKLKPPIYCDLPLHLF